MSSHQTVKIFKKSSIPGVVITQFVNDVPEGCSTPDFEKKPLTLTLQEGKNAIFRAVVKGVPAPEVKWSRTRKGMDDPAKYEMSFNSATNEFILQIKSLVLDDSDLYRCYAVNAYGEASCSAGLRIIQVGFKRKAKYVPVHAADELRKTLLESKKLLRKRVVAPKPKPLDKEAVWQLLLHADKRDYEKICMKYGIVDFRGMLRKLQEIRKDTETEQDKFIHSLRNFEHIKVNKEGNATFSLEMELKSRNSKVYLLKDGERLWYGTGDEYRKHCLRRVGRRYRFTINDVQPEDAGVYQVRVEDIPIFSTELDAQAIPVRFRQPLSDVRCAEAGDAEFQCVLCTPCHEPLWLHKSHLLQASDKHQISVTPDGLTHKLIVRNAVPSDSGLYTLDAGQGSSSAWLLVEYAKGKRRQDEGEKIERETSEWLKETMADNERARKLRRQEQAGDEDHPSFSTSPGVEKTGWYRTGQGSSQGRGQGHSIDPDDGSQRFLGKEGLRKTHINGEMGSGQFSGAGLDGDSGANDGSTFGLKGLGGRSGLRAVHGMDAVSGRAGPGGAVGGAGEWNSVDGRGEGVLGAVNIDMDDGEGLGSQHDKDGNLGDASYRAGFGGAGRLGGGSSVPDGLDPDSTGVGASVGDLFSRTRPGTGAGGGAAGAGMAGRMRSHHGKDGHPTVGDKNGAGINREGQTGTPYGKDGLTPHASGQLGQAERSGSLYVPGGLPGGDRAIAGAGGNFTGEMEALYGPDGQALGAGAGGAGGAGVGGFGAPYGKDGLPAGAGGTGARGLGSPYGKDGLPVGAGIGGAGTGGFGAPYGKDGLPVGAGTGGAGGAGGLGAPYGKDGLPVGAGTGGAGDARGLGAPYGKDGLQFGAGGAGEGGFGEPLYGPDGKQLGAGVGAAGAASARGLGAPYGKDGLPVGGGAGGAGGAGGLGAPYGKDGLPTGPVVGGATTGALGYPRGKDGLAAGFGVGGAAGGGFGGAASPYGMDGFPAGGADAGGLGAPYGKDGLPVAAGAGGAGGAGGLGAPYGKDGLPVGAGAGGAGGAGVFGAPYGKDGLPVGAGIGGAGGAGGLGAPYGKDGLPVGAGIGGAGGAGGLGAPYGKDGLPVGAGSGGAGGAGGLGAPYGKDGLPVGAGTGGSGGVGGLGAPYGKDGLPAGTGIGGAGGAGGLGAPYGKDGLPVGAGGAGGAGGFGEPLYGPDGPPSGAGVGGAGAAGVGGLGSPYGKDGLPAGAGVGGAGAVRGPYGKDGLPAGAGGGGAGGAGVLYGKDGFPAGAVAGGAHFPPGGEEAMGSGRGRDAMLSRALGYAGGGGGEGFSGEGSALWGAGSLYGKDRGSAVARAGASGIGRLGGDEQDLVRGKGGVGGAGGPDGGYGLDAHLGRSLGGETGKGTASDVRGPGNKGSADDRGSLSGPGGARGEGRDFGQLGSLDGTNSAFGGAGSKSHDRSVDGSSSGGFGQGPLSYGQMSGPFGGPPSANQRKQEPDLDLKANDSLNNTESTGQRKRSALDDLKVPRCYLNKQLATMRVLKGDPAELSCTVSRDNVTGAWFKDGLKLTSMDGVIFEKKGLVHKLIINKAEDIHAGKYRFEGGDVKTKASIFVEDPPQVDKVLLKNLTSVPMVAKAREGLKLRIPFEGRGPIRATWLKDRMELGDDTRIRVDKTDTCTTLSISSCDRRDCGDYKVRLKNDSGVLEINLKLVVIDKPQPPAGPIKIVESSASNITIQWKPPKDDGGKPVQRYLVERQQMGRNNWETLGETPRSCTSFTTSKVEEEMSYYFRVRAMNAEGVSDALESGEVKAAGKASPGAPDPPKIISASRDTITISWKAPRKTGTSQIMGYIVQKRKKGTVTWLPVTSVPVKDKKLKVTGLKEGVQYEFRVAAVNAAGTGQPSDPSEPSFARDPTKSPGQVQDLKVSSSDSTSVTLTWNKPEVQDGNDVKGYEVEKRPCNSLSWTKCFTLPAESTSCRVQGLRAGEKLFLRVRALSDSGPGEASELEACAGAAAPVVSPRLLIDDTVKRFLVIKAGNPIRVKIPFEGSPEPVVTWLKDGLPLPSRAAVNTEDGSTQLLLRAAELSDSGTYTVELGNGLGKRETFSFQVQITDIPQPPGAIRLEENVPNTVTVTWDPSASEKWEKNLYYTVLKRESQKGLWHVLGDLIYNNKFTFTTVVPGRDYYFRVVAKNDLGASDPSETVKPWRIWETKAEFRVKAPKYRGVNQNQPPRFLVPLKPHVVVTGSECHMSCAVGGHPPPKITWYKDSRDLSGDPNYFCTNDFGVCSLVVLGATKQDEGEYMVEASNEAGRAFSKAFLAIKDSSL
ncbi:immunoglobulin-like and fibronectin type III domain-containing protein 1 isoform X16 [Corvus kubaryi]|uniref:immunoglobulin-like and fibronectin type III domain-containing protein 1 isoform X16 n=1 Tax=Corvus kubaryi TaxID=68294 RepID=UPI001C04127C|nr:immunoglobulin-like and fibronectin type III domain-containing protein 1 isoform X16 [Corvus kubaryi]